MGLDRPSPPCGVGTGLRPGIIVNGAGVLRVSLDVSAVPDQPVGAGHYILQLAGQLAGRPDIDLVLCSRSTDRDRWSAMVPPDHLLAAAPGPRPLRLAWEQVRLGPLLAASGAAVHHGPHYTMPRRSGLPTACWKRRMRAWNSSC